MKDWLDWIKHVVQMIAAHLPKESYVEVDDAERPETTAVMDAYLDGRYQRVRTDAGDPIFERGFYSYKDWYWMGDAR